MLRSRTILKGTVQAESPDESTKRILLTPWDLPQLLRDPIQRGLLFPKPKPSEQKPNLIKDLKTSLSRTLNFFAPLSGRLAKVEHDDATISFFIDCDNAGALFVHAMADGVTIADVIQPQPVDVPTIYQSFFPSIGTKNYDGISNPLLAVQITELDDGIFMGVVINHVVVDGASLWHFISSWSEISRGLTLSKPPLLQRWFPQGNEGLIRIPPLSGDEISHRFALPPLKEKLFHFSREAVAKLKAKANAEMGTNQISSLQALLSHVWRSMVRCRRLDPDQDATCILIIDARPRLQLPEAYFGNAIQGGWVTMKARELLENGVGYAALQMNEMVASHTQDKLTSLVSSWIAKPHLYTRGNKVIVSSSPRFDVYGNDFGWGRPIATKTGIGSKCDGNITASAGVEKGTVDITLCLSPETMVAMCSDPEFMAVVTT